MTPEEMAGFITEPERRTAVAYEADLCVVGGGSSGVFAAVRAARLGLRVALVEQNATLGGMATAALVNHWHSTYDVDGKIKVIGGLLDELIHSLRQQNAIIELPQPARIQYKFNSAVLACALDRLALENGVRLFLGARFSLPVMHERRVDAIVIEDKSGRRAIRAKLFIDASGDGDLLRRAGFAAIQHHPLQPVSYQVLASGIQQLADSNPGIDIWQEVRALAQQHGFPDSNPWLGPLPGLPALNNVFGARLNGVDASDPDQLSQAYLEGRRLAVAYLAMIRARFPQAAEQIALVAVAQALGVRETWHACCLHRLSRDELLYGEPFEDAIANGTYPVDVHHPDGTRLLYLDGREHVIATGGEGVWRRWRAQGESTPACYHIPYRSLVPQGASNLLVAGRLIDADRDAYGAIRVMVNCHQTGEAAGVAAALALQDQIAVGDVPPHKLRNALAAGGSLIV